MKCSLNDEKIYGWWKDIRERSGYITKIHKPSTLFGAKRIIIGDIPNELCYRYLASCGFECNVHGEILITPDQADAYIDFQNMMI